MKHLLLICAIGLTVPLRADTAPVDPNLETALRRAFNLGPDDPITEDHFNDLTQLRVVAYNESDDDDDGGAVIPGLPLTQLDGLECAPHLQTIELVGREDARHQITDTTPLKGMKRLRRLEMDYALSGTEEELTASIDNIAGLSSLRILTLEGNHLTKDNIGALPNLERVRTLDIDNNDISSIAPLADFIQVRHLDIDDNPITDLSPLARMQWLQQLDLTPIKNGINSLPPLRNLFELKVVTDELGPVARMPKVDQLILPGDSFKFPPSRVADITPLANTGTRYIHFNSAAVSKGYKDIIPLVYRQGATSPSVSRGTLISLARNSRADFSDPATAALFEEFNITEAELDLYTTKYDKVLPDGSLRARIKSRLSLPHDPGRDDLLNLVNLEVSSVQSLVGLDEATNLTALLCMDGWVTDLSPLAGLTSLQTVDLRNNFITDVTPLVSLDLTSIDLRGNPIDLDTVPAGWFGNEAILFDHPEPLDPSEAIPDPALRAAIRISLGMAEDAPLGIGDVGRLKTLYADSCGIRSLEGLNAAFKLEGISLRNNVIKDLRPIPTFPIRWIRVSGNPLDAASLGILETAKQVGISVDNDEDSRFLSAITPVDGVVYADRYQLSSIAYLAPFEEITTVHLTGNHLVEIDVLLELPNLESVYLEENLLHFATGSDAGLIVDTLRNRGVEVHFERQRPETAHPITVQQQALAKALADGMGLTFIPPTFTEQQLAEIQRFDWERSTSGITLEDPDFISRLTGLKYLSLERAGLTDISFLSNLTELETLDIDFNDITDLGPLMGLTKLVELDINDNSLNELSSLVEMSNLLYLDADDNQLSNIFGVSPLSSLVDLDLNNNELVSIEALAPLQQLEFLNLSDNNIWNLATLPDLTSLRELNVTHNLVPFYETGQQEILAELRDNLFIHVDSPQRPSDVELLYEGDDLFVQWSTEPNIRYNLQITSDFESGFDGLWTTRTQEDPGVARFKLPSTAAERAFFRIVPSRF